MGSTMGLYRFLDKFFFVFHSLLILFNLSGWMWKKTRRLNLVLLLLTGFSWTILGIWYGFGFCPSTEGHWQVRMKLGLPDMPNSYIKFLIDKITGWNVNASFVDILTLVLFLVALTASLWTNINDWRNR
jgi:hypothetical protein